MSSITVVCECDACHGTGLYSGFMEAKGEAVICTVCCGTGKQVLNLKPFNRRKHKPGITRIRAGSGTILDDPSRARWLSYEEFEQKIPDSD